MSRIFHSAFLALTLLLCACASNTTHTDDGPLTPLPGDLSHVLDPSDAVFASAVKEYLKSRGDPAFSRYEFSRIDLNHDGRREALVLMVSPHHYWCGMNGCKMMVFEAYNEGFSPVAEVAPVRGPLVVSNTETNGWKDLIVRVSGRLNLDAKDVALRYDGDTYPQKPALQPALYASYEPQGVKIFPR